MMTQMMRMVMKKVKVSQALHEKAPVLHTDPPTDATIPLVGQSIANQGMQRKSMVPMGSLLQVRKVRKVWTRKRMKLGVHWP